jgi:N-acetyl-D-muramate 6-phosphate phosphatase
MYQAAVLDFDGTLLDSYKKGLERVENLVKKNGLIVTPEIRQKMLAAWGKSGVTFLSDLFGIDRERAERMYVEWEAMDVDDPIPFIEGSREALAWLRSEGFIICMLTSRRRMSVVPMLEAARLQDYFTHITAHEDCGYHKPDPRAFENILHMLASQDITKNECLFVGDTFVDIEAGRNVGIRTVVVETGPYRHEHYKTHPTPEDHVIPSIKHFPSWVARLRS